MRQIILLGFLIVFAASVAGYTQNSVVQILESGHCTVLQRIELQGSGEFLLMLPVQNVKDLQVNDAVGELNFSLQGQELKVFLREGEKHSLQIEFYSDEFTSKAGEEWSFSFKTNTGADEENLKIIMPENVKVTAISEDSELYFEGSQMIIEWKNLLKAEAEVKYSIEMQKQEEPAENLLANVLMLLIGALLLVGLGLFIWKNFKEIKKPMVVEKVKGEKEGKVMEEKGELSEGKEELSEGKRDLMKTLSEREKNIVQALLKNLEGINQKKLTMLTGLPKSTLSRALKKLEERGFVKIAQEGYTKRISLSEWFLKK